MSAPTVNKIKTKLFLPSFKRATHVLEGEYAALTRGRSMDFDDLREYTFGDEIKDIDWKASSRSLNPLVKRYNSNRKHPITFLVDTGKSMEAVTAKSEIKKTIATEIVGVLGYIAINHSDTVGFFYGDGNHINHIPYKETENHLNRSLAAVYNSVSVTSGDSNVKNLLHYGAKALRQRGITVIITSEISLDPEFQTYLKHIGVTQEIFWVTVSDADPLQFVTTQNEYIQDIETLQVIPDYIRGNKKLQNLFHENEQQRENMLAEFMTKMSINHTHISTSDEIIPTLIKLLDRSSRGRK